MDNPMTNPVFDEIFCLTPHRKAYVSVPTETLLYEGDIKLCDIYETIPLKEGTMRIYGTADNEVTCVKISTPSGEVDVSSLFEPDDWTGFFE